MDEAVDLGRGVHRCDGGDSCVERGMTARTLRLDLPWPPRGLSPNARLNMFSKNNLFQKTKRGAVTECRRAMITAGIGSITPKGGKSRRDGGRLNLTLICTPPLLRYRDEDNLIATCKAVFDGIAEAAQIDDCLFHFREQAWMPPDPARKGALTIVLDWEEER